MLVYICGLGITSFILILISRPIGCCFKKDKCPWAPVDKKEITCTNMKGIRYSRESINQAEKKLNTSEKNRTTKKITANIFTDVSSKCVKT